MERDDLIVNDSYALNAHHSEEAGVKIRKNIWKVTIILTLITAVEVLLGAYVKKEPGELYWEMVVIGFIAMTIIKARYIVLQFMHLGDERNNMRKTILIPYIVFILYATVLISIIEGGWQGLIQILP
jgi:cytochrome c oxidase subunit IV